MISKSEIIKEVATSQDYQDICRRICSDNSLHKDLFQELIIILLEKEEQKIIDLYENKQLKWFVIKIIQNQWQSSSSPFYKKYKDFQSKTNEIQFEIAETTDADSSRFNIIDTELSREVFESKKEWYENKLTHSYIESGSLRKLATKTRISRNAISYSLNSFKSLILQKEKQFIEFMENQITCIKLSDEAKHIIFADAQKQNLDPEKYIEKILVEKSKEKCQK